MGHAILMAATRRARAGLALPALLATLLLATLLLAAAPSRAEGAPLPVEEVAPGVFVHEGVHELTTEANRGGIANLGFVVGEDAVAVIDAGGSPAVGRALLAAIRARTDRPVAFVVSTHMHPDHVFGNVAFRGAGEGGADPVFVGHANLPRALASRAEHYLATGREALGEALMAGVDLRPPDRLVEREAALDLGGRRLLLRAWGTAHTDNDLSALDEATGTLFAGDLVFLGHLPVIDGSLLGWLAAMEDLAALPARRVVPGHGPASAPWPEALAPQRAYLEGLAADLRALLAEGAGLAEAVERVPAPRGGPEGGWALVEAHHRRNATAGYAELEWE